VDPASPHDIAVAAIPALPKVVREDVHSVRSITVVSVFINRLQDGALDKLLVSKCGPRIPSYRWHLAAGEGRRRGRSP
jgi:hypothetical protein